jgi:hypothetical protein
MIPMMDHRRVQDIRLQVFFSIMKKQDFQLIPGRENEADIHFKEHISPEDLPFNLLWTFRIK